MSLTNPIALAAALCMLAGCATTPGGGSARSAAALSAVITPYDAIQRAAAAAPDGIEGVFEMRVLATGRKNGSGFLNSETDYRDQRNLTIAIEPGALARLEADAGASGIDTFKGRTIRVTGSARRTRIALVASGRVTDKYYYQTHVRVSDPAQIDIVAGG